MAWDLLPVDYTDAVWQGFKKYNQIDNDDGTISLQDVTIYTNKEKSFFGALQANRMDEALNTLMSMVENGTDLYEAFTNYFNEQKNLFAQKGDEKYQEVIDIADELLTKMNTDYEGKITDFEKGQEAIFNFWFDYIKGQLSTDAAGHLQNQILDMQDKINSVVNVTLRLEDWEESSAGKYTQTVAVEHVTEDDEPICLSLVNADMTVAEQKIYMKNLSIIAAGAAEATNGHITFTVFKAPSATIEIGLKGINTIESYTALISDRLTPLSNDEIDVLTQGGN